MLSVNKKNNKKLEQEKIIARMLEALDKDIAGLAEFLGNTPESISMWKTRNVPPKALIKVSKETGKSVEWLMGQNTGNSKSVFELQENYPQDKKWPELMNCWKKLSEEQKSEVLGFVKGIVAGFPPELKQNAAKVVDFPAKKSA